MQNNSKQAHEGKKQRISESIIKWQQRRWFDLYNKSQKNSPNQKNYFSYKFVSNQSTLIIYPLWFWIQQLQNIRHLGRLPMCLYVKVLIDKLPLAELSANRVQDKFQ